MALYYLSKGEPRISDQLNDPITLSSVNLRVVMEIQSIHRLKKLDPFEPSIGYSYNNVSTFQFTIKSSESID